MLRRTAHSENQGKRVLILPQSDGEPKVPYIQVLASIIRTLETPVVLAAALIARTYDLATPA